MLYCQIAVIGSFALKLVFTFLSLLTDKASKFYPIIFAIGLTGYIMVPIDYGNDVTHVHLMMVMLCFGFTVFNFWHSF